MIPEEITIDLFFRIEGERCDVDHGYPLFSAISHWLDRPPADPLFHQDSAVGLHRLRGSYQGNGKLKLGPQACFGLRLPKSRVADALVLSGKQLRLNGDTIRVGSVFTRELHPAPTLYAHMVTTRNGHEAQRFQQEIQRQCETLGLGARVECGPRRILTVKGKRIVGFALLATELTAGESLRLQEHGLGGRRRMGCGMFSPWQR